MSDTAPNRSRTPARRRPRPLLAQPAAPIRPPAHPGPPPTPGGAARTTTLRETLYRSARARRTRRWSPTTASGLPLGLVTLREMLHVISFEGGGLEDPVAAHMIGAPLTIAADSPAHRAKVLMAKQGARHLLLTEARRPAVRAGRSGGPAGAARRRGRGPDRGHRRRPRPGRHDPRRRIRCGAAAPNCSTPAWGSRRSASGCPGSTT